jgi:UDP-N-acetylglucosamine 2-epimerase (non-hydrolysing)
MNVLVVVGTRPEAIKMAPVVRALDASPAHRRTLCAVLQQRAMLLDALATFDLVPDRVVEAGPPSADPTERLGAILVALRDVLHEVRPDLLLVHGDTTTALGAALAAFHARIPVAHVEGGLRSFALDAPWPEEGHRVVIDALSTWILVPCDEARENLVREGLGDRRIVVTGNPIVDAVESIRARAVAIDATTLSGLAPLAPDARLVTVTCHRREQHGAGLERIAGAIAEIATRRDDVRVVWPVHDHPAAQDPIRARLAGVPRVHVAPPLPYDRFLSLLAASALVITDSGGVQEEAPLLGRPLLVARDRTERPEIIASGAARLVGTEPSAIRDAALAVLADASVGEAMSRARFPYGTLGAGERIVRALEASA